MRLLLEVSCMSILRGRRGRFQDCCGGNTGQEYYHTTKLVLMIHKLNSNVFQLPQRDN